ncbi:dephospho-CoA kinase [Aureibacter tunicatorum]|uniref:Dephospho-CoA kinase n=1 Tax=Aureibacter tunicatorum TaxID=866807 RepID=A0AAE4BS98_9BACT|nr:dephospho-CoA kinase [Aureibacter tunicatorum]MDR6238633.1 dephospho-CoA kinase [Aureibacter tunicatorum]BDD05436.1 dephospho-CoA kinase [Aureibacter tunicatorum]
MKKIGVTGGIGSGKSTVCQYFELKGVPVYYADDRAKVLMISNPKIIEGVEGLFGDEAYNSDGALNRQMIAEKAFYDQSLLTKLNEIVHPVVYSDFDEWCQIHKDQPYIIKEAAIMLEKKDQALDYVIGVIAPVQDRILRILKRDPQRNQSQVQGIMDKQVSDQLIKDKADFVLYNDNETKLLPELNRLHSFFSKL